MSENNFTNTVESLFKGMDAFITTKTVVGALALLPVHLQTTPKRKTTVAAVWAVKSSQVPC